MSLTTHLDIQAVESLQDALKEFPGTVCFVSHDIEFIRGVADTIYQISPSGFRKFHGNYDYYISKTRDEKVAAEKEEKVEVQQESGESRKEQRRREAEERKALKKKRGPLEKRTQALEALIADLEEEEKSLVEEFYQDPPADRVKVMNERLDVISSEKEAAEAEWEEKLMELEEVLGPWGRGLSPAVHASLLVVVVSGAGFIAHRKDVIKQGHSTSLTNLLIKVLMPALIFSSITQNETFLESNLVVMAPLMGFSFVCLSFAVSYILAKLLLRGELGDSENRRSFVTACGMHNYGFVAIPVIMTLYPDEDLIGPLLMHNVGVEIAMWSVACSTLKEV